MFKLDIDGFADYQIHRHNPPVCADGEEFQRHDTSCGRYGPYEGCLRVGETQCVCFHTRGPKD
ncbi:MAG: hypothetical protein ACE5KH_01685 [Candidatus Geothermarchaeales archaeon]